MPGYPNLLMHLARSKLSDTEMCNFEYDVEMIGRLQRDVPKISDRCSRRKARYQDPRELAEKILSAMAESLADVETVGPDGVKLIMDAHNLTLSDLLTMTHGELLNRSPIVQKISVRLFTTEFRPNKPR